MNSRKYFYNKSNINIFEGKLQLRKNYNRNTESLITIQIEVYNLIRIPKQITE